MASLDDVIKGNDTLRKLLESGDVDGFLKALPEMREEIAAFMQASNIEMCKDRITERAAMARQAFQSGKISTWDEAAALFANGE